MCERYINQLPLAHSQLGTWSATEACGLTRHWTGTFSSQASTQSTKLYQPGLGTFSRWRSNDLMFCHHLSSLLLHCAVTVTSRSLGMPSLQFRKAARFPSLGGLGHQERRFSHPSAPIPCHRQSEMVFRWNFLDPLCLNSVQGPRLVDLKKYISNKTHILHKKELTSCGNQNTLSEETVYELGLLK